MGLEAAVVLLTEVKLDLLQFEIEFARLVHLYIVHWSLVGILQWGIHGLSHRVFTSSVVSIV